MLWRKVVASDIGQCSANKHSHNKDSCQLALVSTLKTRKQHTKHTHTHTVSHVQYILTHMSHMPSDIVCTHAMHDDISSCSIRVRIAAGLM